VPYLIEELKDNQLTEIDQFIGGVLSTISCYRFDITSHATLVEQVEKWWKIHQYQTEQKWILDALESGDSNRMSYAHRRTDKLTNPQDKVRLITYLKSKDMRVVSSALYILWKVFKSDEALKYVSKACINGTKEQKMLALGFCGDNKISSLSPIVAKVLQKETDYQVLGKALDAARNISAYECIPIIEKMDSAPSSKYPMVYVIRALAELKSTAYGDRVLYHLKNGEHGARMAAAEVINYCVPQEKALTPLITALKDPDDNVRRYACISLRFSASSIRNRHRLGEIIPLLIELIRKGESDLDRLASDTLKQICTAHFGQDALPKVDNSLAEPQFSQQALSIWEEWWNQHNNNRGQ
jgi:hypothetical protein